MNSSQVRQAFIDFFVKEGHNYIPSSSLIPQGDPTLLFVNAGMVQFKDVFLGAENRNYKRATSYQRCMRVSGKHNDLENVGYTARHHTLFEMLGNFSFGDYFKEEAIDFAWRFVVDTLNLPLDKLYFTVFREDDQALQLWHKRGAKKDRILRFDEEDNFWAMGDTGPCGPNSEILYDQGPTVGCGRPDCAPGCSCDRYLEIWNLVFMQFDRDKSGNMKPLKKCGVDTGMGLERVVAIMQGKKSNYETDLFLPIIEATEKISGKKYGENQRDSTAMRVIGDHIRACAFLVADGVMPANNGAGYVLRKILRRAARYGDILGIEGTFLHKLAPVVTENLSVAYDFLSEKKEHISKVISMEEERFGATLNQGRHMMDEIISKCSNSGTIPGEAAFKLYDTFGFPLDLTRDLAQSAGLTVDIKGYEENMALQRERAQSASKFSTACDDIMDINQEMETCFLGYDDLFMESQLLFVKENLVALDKTPFYAESGGQVSDNGSLIGPDNQEIMVENVKKNSSGQIIHHLGKSVNWQIGDKIIAKVDREKRSATQRNHTATHLLHGALREILGDHVVQAGSLVAPARLRFDFKHYGAMTQDQLQRVEALVNRGILSNFPVSWKEVDIVEARNEGAIMLFGEKYGEKVRVVDIADYSKELCGGCHVEQTGEIGFFKIISETAIGANIRRIEALTGLAAMEWVNNRLEYLEKSASLLRCPASELTERIEKLLSEKKELTHELNDLRVKSAASDGKKATQNAEEINGIKFIAQRMDGLSVAQLRDTADEIGDKLGSGVVILGTGEPKVLFIAKVTKDLVNRGINAGKLVKVIAQATGGDGGGRGDFAQAGGRDPQKIEEAFKAGAKALWEMSGEK